MSVDAKIGVGVGIGIAVALGIRALGGWLLHQRRSKAEGATATELDSTGGALGHNPTEFQHGSPDEATKLYRESKFSQNSQPLSTQHSLYSDQYGSTPLNGQVNNSPQRMPAQLDGDSIYNRTYELQ